MASTLIRRPGNMKPAYSRRTRVCMSCLRVRESSHTTNGRGHKRRTTLQVGTPRRTLLLDVSCSSSGTVLGYDMIAEAAAAAAVAAVGRRSDVLRPRGTGIEQPLACVHPRSRTRSTTAVDTRRTCSQRRSRKCNKQRRCDRECDLARTNMN